MFARTHAGDAKTVVEQAIPARDEPPPPESWRPFAYSAMVFGAAALAATAVVYLLHAAGGHEGLTRGVLGVFPALLALGALRTARAATGRSRAMWRLLSVSGGLWAVAEATRLHGHAMTADDPSASLVLGDAVGLLAAIPAAAMLIGLIPRQARSERRRLVLSALVIAGSVFFLLASLAPHAVSRPTDAPPFVSAVWMAYPIAYVGLASLALFVLARKRYDAGIALRLVATGFILFALASATGGGQAAPETGLAVVGPYVARLLAFLALLLAARVPGAARLFDPRPEDRFERPGSPQSLLVFVPLLSLVVVVSGLTASADDLVLRVTEIVTLLLFGLRQALIARESANLVEELQRTSSSLARLARQNERTIEAVSDGIIGVDSDGRVSFANRAALAILGCDESEILGKTPIECFLARRVDGHGRPTADPIEIALRSECPSGPKTAVFARRDGTELPVEWSAGPLQDGPGESDGAVVVFRDITRRREVERLKDDFVSVVNHELRTPLTSIRGVLGLLDGGVLGALTDKGRSLVRGGVESTERLTRLVNDLLDFDRIESGAATLQLADRDVEHLIQTALDGVRPLAAGVPVSLELGEVDGRVHADSDRIVQTLTNLLGNAIKFSPPRTTITTSAVRRLGVVQFTVSDQGRGIPADKLEEIFERFEQVDASDSHLRGGTGLGLAISRTIVRRHGGEIWAENGPGAGSTFHFTIPAADAQRAESAGNAAPAGVPGRVRHKHATDVEAMAAHGGRSDVGRLPVWAGDVRDHAEAPV